MTIDYSKRPKGMSKREYFAQQTGRPKSEYEKGSSGDTEISSIVKSILGATPGFNNPDKTFDEFYGEKQQAEDRKQSEALFSPYFEKQISDSLEDLNAWSEMDSINYNRTLRQGRSKMAQLGAAIGKERRDFEGEVTKEHEMGKQAKVRQTERQVGSEAIKKAGYSSIYGDRLGELTDKRNSAIEEQVLWYRDQAMNQYNSTVNTAYKRPSNTNFLGAKL